MRQGNCSKVLQKIASLYPQGPSATGNRFSSGSATFPHYGCQVAKKRERPPANPGVSAKETRALRPWWRIIDSGLGLAAAAASAMQQLEAFFLPSPPLEGASRTNGGDDDDDDDDESRCISLCPPLAKSRKRPPRPPVGTVEAADLLSYTYTSLLHALQNVHCTITEGVWRNHEQVHSREWNLQTDCSGLSLLECPHFPRKSGKSTYLVSVKEA